MRRRQTLRQFGTPKNLTEPLNAREEAVASSNIEPRRVKRQSADVVKPKVYTRPRPFDLLAARPVSLAGMSQAERDLLIVTAVADEFGNEYPVSRIGDPVWHLASESEVKNRKACEFSITWPNDVPKALLDDAKAALYCALLRGPHGIPWTASYVYRTAVGARVLLRHLASLRIATFRMVRALHLSDYIADLKRTLKPSAIRNRLDIIGLVWDFPQDVLYPLSEHPWGGVTAQQAFGFNEDDNDSMAGRTGKTPVVPRSLQRDLFAYCEARLGEAEELFQKRDEGKISPSNPAFTRVRDSVLYLTQITSGMRNSESIAITSGCWRSEVRNGVTFHWVRTKEFKTKRGEVEFLVPPETLRALEILQRYAEPMQARLVDEAQWLEMLLQRGVNKDGLLENGMAVVEAVGRLNDVRDMKRHLFLCVSTSASDHLGTGSRIGTISAISCNVQLKALARAVGSDWELANHQCRRTFAYNVANSRLGRMGLVFLKWQLKHASMSWTQLYASNPYQDLGLYRELHEEQTAARVELMEGWMDSDGPLSGGAGRKLMQTRATPVKNFKELLLHTAETIEIRSTGHSWCLSGTRVCHGQGVYEPANCVGCSQAIIEEDHAAIWQMIHLDNLRLAAITDCGPSVRQKAQRAIARSEEVLSELQVPLPSSEQAAAYAALGVFA
ncbi:integrase [Paraburkholderia fynbosensis]|uniref:Tyr recombinase domain-containing protein n=1 Tax=Paraburkholderia fynbosensis TaxID=1200993 RepID=A0A6J5G677_9BURK|nr:integrase [Paraburkholderia fynbosensis]CAB3794460.1 hypothetical protein LMG27177_03632 [Paraburkholderia fynbosensis]